MDALTDTRTNGQRDDRVTELFLSPLRGQRQQKWRVTLRHVRIISACFPKPSTDAPLPAFIRKFVKCLRCDTRYYLHSDRSLYLIANSESSNTNKLRSTCLYWLNISAVAVNF